MLSFFPLQLLCPYSCQGTVAKEAMQIVLDIVCGLETKYRARIVTMTDGCITIYSLTKNEGDGCFREIEATIKSNLIVTKTISISHFQALYLEANEKLKPAVRINMVAFSVLKDQSNDCKVTLKGTVNGVDGVMEKLKCYIETHYSETSFDIEVDTRYVKMWFKHWQQLKIQKEAHEDVMLQFVQKHGNPNVAGTTFVTFHLWGDANCVDTLKSLILTRDCGNWIKGKLLMLPQQGATVIAKGLKDNEINIHSLAIEVEIDEASNTMTIVAPIQVSDEDIRKAGEIIMVYLENQKSIFTLSDPIMGLILASTKYSTKLNDITHPHNVKVTVPKFPKCDLTLIGNLAGIQNVEKDLQQLQTLMCKDIDQVILRVDPQHVPVIESSEFVQFCKTIQDELFVCYKRGYRKANTIIENSLFIQPTPLSHCIKFEAVQGSIVNEHVYAIVNNANEHLQHTDGVAKLIADAGGPSIQSDCDYYIKSHGKLKPGEVVCFGGGSLLCSKLIHAVWPHSRLGKNNAKDICGTFANILNLAESAKVESISFSLFGTNIPPNVFVQTLFKAISDFCTLHTGTHAFMQKVRCVLPNKSSTIDAFISTLRKYIPEHPGFSWLDDPPRKKQELQNCTGKPHPKVTETCASPDSWQWQDDNGSFVDYSVEICKEFSSMYAKNPLDSLFQTIGGYIYIIDFNTMTQTNTTTMKQRPIQCSISTTAAPSLTATLKEHLDDTSSTGDDVFNTILLRGFKVNLETAKSSILEMLNAACSSEDIPHSLNTNTCFLTFPPEWQPQTKTTELFPLSAESTEWSHVTQLFQQTMPPTMCTLSSIRRIQNKWLWERYFQHRKRLDVKNEGLVNEKELFHGTRTNEPRLIYEGEDGFDMRYSAEGMWGKANYFAVKASYSNSYAHVNANTGKKEMFLVKVLTGESYDCAPNSSLRVPPPKPGRSGGKLQLEQLKYDTVTGSTGGSQVFMAYDNEKAYPAYLIEYKEL